MFPINLEKICSFISNSITFHWKENKKTKKQATQWKIKKKKKQR